MIEVPKNFQFRLKDEPGYTHSGKIVGGECKVVWARGFERYYMDKTGRSVFPCTHWSVQDLANQFVNRRWILVVDEKKAQEQSLPDVFYFKHSASGDELHNATRKDKGNYTITWHCGAKENYRAGGVEYYVRNKCWNPCAKPVLTAEQLRANKELREQVAALENSIKLNRQDIAHREILIANYEQRKQNLLSEIIEETK